MAITIAPKSIRQYVAQYFEATRSNDAQKWANRFSPDAIVEDPVGTAPIDNSAKILELGKAFISNFKTVGLHEEFVHVVGNEAAARWTRKGITKEGKQARFEGINLFEFNRDGQIVKLKGYWSSDNIVEIEQKLRLLMNNKKNNI